MPTVNPINGGFEVLGASSVAASLLLSPANGPTTVVGKFPRTAANAPNSISGLLVFNCSDGTQESLSLALGASTPSPIPFPSTLFSGRSGTWSVVDQGAWRTLSINVGSTDGTGTDDSWSLDFTVCVPGGGVSNFFVVSSTPQGTVSGVEVTPTA